MDCKICGNDIRKTQSVGHINRALKMDRNIYCSKECSFMGRRKNISIEEKKILKARYDREYKIKNKERDKPRKAAYHKKTYDPIKRRAYNQSRMSLHVEYCRRPKYKAYKKEYDSKHRAKKNYGELWESSLILKNIKSEIDNRQAKQLNQLINKSQKRKRTCKRTKDYLQTI